MANRTVQEVARILGITKCSWSRATQCYKKAIEDGFTDEDLIEAARNMAKAEKQYQSIYSVFLKPDYWMAKSEPVTPKGVW